MLILIWDFERKLKMMLNLYYLLHLFRILTITFCSKFQLIQDWCFLKGNSIIYNFYRNRENQISMFSRPKMRFKLLLKIMTFLEHFSVFFFFFFNFFNFSWIISPKKISKEQIRWYKEKLFYYFFKKWNKMKSNKKSHLINFKLILVRTNQN